jgi:hypothetical protein
MFVKKLAWAGWHFSWHFDQNKRNNLKSGPNHDKTHNNGQKCFKSEK